MGSQRAEHDWVTELSWGGTQWPSWSTSGRTITCTICTLTWWKLLHILLKTSSAYLQNYIASEMLVARGKLLRSESYYLDMSSETSHYAPCFSDSVIKTQDGLVASFTSSSAHTVSRGVCTVTTGNQDTFLHWKGKSSVWGVCERERDREMGAGGWVKGQRGLTRRTVGASSR